MSGPFVILEFADNGTGTATEPPTVYVDGFTGALFLDKPGEIERYDKAFKDIWNASLDEETSQQAIRDAAKEMKG